MAQTYKVQAPSRADLAGGTLDLWPLYSFVGGARTINVALDMYATVEVVAEPSSAFELHILMADGTSAKLEAPLEPKEWMALPAMARFPAAVASCWMAGQEKLPQSRVRLRCTTEVPPRSGLGGSSTLCVALAKALGRLTLQFQEKDWQWSLLHWVKDVEARYLTMFTGTQDYLAAIFGGVNSFNFRYGVLDRTQYGEEAVSGLAERALVLYSGEVHDSGSSNWEIVKSVIEGKGDSMRGLSEIAGVAEDMHRELTKPSIDWNAVGKLVSNEWDVRRALFKVNTPRLDEILGFLKKQGVMGAKVCGAAQGGSLLALIDPAKREEITRACAAGGIEVLRAKPSRTGVAVS